MEQIYMFLNPKELSLCDTTSHRCLQILILIVQLLVLLKYLIASTVAIWFNEVLEGHFKTLTNGKTCSSSNMSVCKPVCHKKPKAFPALFLEDVSQVMHYL